MVEDETVHPLSARVHIPLWFTVAIVIGGLLVGHLLTGYLGWARWIGVFLAIPLVAAAQIAWSAVHSHGPRVGTPSSQ